jgi:hypothetical protein
MEGVIQPLTGVLGMPVLLRASSARIDSAGLPPTVSGLVLKLIHVWNDAVKEKTR